jgi:hypothetical protein
MIQLASFGTLACVVLLGWFAAELVRLWETRGDSHLMHGPNDGCVECEDK